MIATVSDAAGAWAIRHAPRDDFTAPAVQHRWEEEVEYDAHVRAGFSELKPSAYTAAASDGALDVRQSPADKSNMARYLFGGFSRCLYPVQKFDSEAERILAVILRGMTRSRTT